MMRLDRAQLEAITGKLRGSAQASWFKRHFGVTVPVDHAGPIITEQVYQDLIRAKCGLLDTSKGPARPQVKLKKAA